MRFEKINSKLFYQNLRHLVIFHYKNTVKNGAFCHRLVTSHSS